MALPGLPVLYHENHVLIWTHTINHSINLNQRLSFKFCLIVVKRRLKICGVWPAPWRCTNSGNNHTDLIHRLEIPYWHWSLRSAVVSHITDQLNPSWQKLYFTFQENVAVVYHIYSSFLSHYKSQITGPFYFTVTLNSLQVPWVVKQTLPTHKGHWPWHQEAQSKERLLYYELIPTGGHGTSPKNCVPALPDMDDIFGDH